MDGSTTTPLEHRSAQLIDQFGRHKHKLRISLTDHCKFVVVIACPIGRNGWQKKTS